MPVVGRGAWNAREPSFDESGNPGAWLDTKQEEEHPSERAIEEETLPAPKLIKQALEKRGERLF